MRFPGFVGPSYVSQSPRASIQRCVNWYVEQVEVQDEPARAVLYPTPGCASIATFPVTDASDQSVLGMTSVYTGNRDRCFVAVGHNLYEIGGDGATTLLGAMVWDGQPVTFAANVDAGDQVFLTSGGRGYILTLSTNALTEVKYGSGENILAATQGAFLDGFFLALDTSTSTLQISELNDGTKTWDATQVAQRTAGSDPWDAILVAHRDIWLFGRNTSEVWYNAGTSPFPFAPIPGAFLEEGIIAPFSAARVGNTVVWLGGSEEGACMVWMAKGYIPQRISTHAVEFAIQGYVRDGLNVNDAVAFTYQDGGHQFYVLNFPSANATWVFDAITGLWHERGTWNAPERRYDAWRPQHHAYAFGKHLVGDREAGEVYDLSINNFLDAGGGVIRRVRRTPHLTMENLSLFYHRFQILLETGLGASTGQGSDPQIMVRWSDDGGHNWGNEHWVSAGKLGEYNARAIWRRLGRGRDRVFEVAVSDPIPWRLIAAYVDVSQGSS